jgi:L-2-hydroxyglutarate oxidase
MIVESDAGSVEASCVVGCAGLYSDRVAAMAGLEPNVQIVPFRGEYYALTPEAEHLCRGLVYPVPNPNFPFLGVHFTKTIAGGVECGPNAVLAFAREGYDRWTVDGKELMETFRYKGFQKLAAKYWRAGLMELWRSFSKQSFHRALQKLIPAVKIEELVPIEAGVRAQAVTPDGQLVDDFLIKEEPGVIHVLNAPSPAATASLNIGLTIAERVQAQLQAA